MTNMKIVFLLLVIYQFKHLLADYFLQGRYMMGKFGKYPDYVGPLLAHVGVHGAFTLVIATLFYCGYAPYLALLDMTVHFIMDRIKASPDMLGRFKALSAREMEEILYDKQHYIKRFPGTQTSLNMQERHTERLKSNQYFWWSLGVDQLVHHLTHYGIIYLIIILS